MKFGARKFFLPPKTKNLKSDLRNIETPPLQERDGDQIFNFFVSQQILMKFGIRVFWPARTKSAVRFSKFWNSFIILKLWIATSGALVRYFQKNQKCILDTIQTSISDRKLCKLRQWIYVYNASYQPWYNWSNIYN